MRTAGYVLAGVGTLVLIFVVAWVLFLASIFGPRNVSAQFDVLYTNHNSLAAAARNVCTARDDEAAAPVGMTRDQRTSQRIAYEQNYRRIEADYNQAVQNIFKAGLVKPADLPVQAPTLENAVIQWCPLP